MRKITHKDAFTQGGAAPFLIGIMALTVFFNLNAPNPFFFVIIGAIMGIYLKSFLIYVLWLLLPVVRFFNKNPVESSPRDLDGENIEIYDHNNQRVGSIR